MSTFPPSLGPVTILPSFWTVSHIKRPGGGPNLVFEPADVLFLDGGVAIRMEAFETDHPVLLVAHWNNRDAKGREQWRRFPMRLETDVEWADRLEREARHRERAEIKKAGAHV